MPLVVWPKVYEEYRSAIKGPVVAVEGFVPRRDGTMNVVVGRVEAVPVEAQTPGSKDWGKNPRGCA